MHFSPGFCAVFRRFHSGRPFLRPRRPPGRGPGVRQKPLKTAPAGAKCLGKGLGSRPFRVKSLGKAAETAHLRVKCLEKTGNASQTHCSLSAMAKKCKFPCIYVCVFRGDSSAAAASPGDRWGGQQKAKKTQQYYSVFPINELFSFRHHTDGVWMSASSC